MSWDIVEFETPRGERPVADFIKKQQPQAVSKIVHHIDLLEKYGFLLSMPHSKRLNERLCELRIRGKEELRILYCFKGKTIYLLHGFKKQKQKTPRNEIVTAERRYLSLT